MFTSFHNLWFSFLEATGQKVYQAFSFFLLEPLTFLSRQLQNNQKEKKNVDAKRSKIIINPLSTQRTSEQQFLERRQTLARGSLSYRSELKTSSRSLAATSTSLQRRLSKNEDEEDIPVMMYGIGPDDVDERFDSFYNVMHNTFNEDDEDYELPVSAPPTSLSQSVSQSRIAQLEEELLRLRSEISRFMAESANRTKAPPSIPDSMKAPPPPPPPPPPSLASESEVAPVDSNANLTKTPRPPTKLPPNQATPMSLAAFLQQAVLSGKPQLRHVEGVRSPGGTIQRPKLRVSDPQTPSRFSDSTSILANALKQRFKSVSSDSVESSPETSEKSKSVRIPAETRICENEKNKTQIKESNDSTPPSRPLLQEPAEP